MDQPFIVGTAESALGKIPRVSSVLKWEDRFGTFKARWGVGRMNYLVDPGLYALENPGPRSPVFVTANYKMSFDCLREALGKADAWILVLDTKGINVWCAAGKGTLGTEELVRRVQTTGLEKVVDHRELILPQLGAPGIAAHIVKKLSNFRVIYGPIQARDIAAFLAAGMRATPEMRRKTFDLRERTVLIPIELVAALKPLAGVLPILFVLGGLLGSGTFWFGAWNHGFLAVLAILLAVGMGAVANPLLLPYIPAKAFAAKGLILGVAGTLLLWISAGGFEGIQWGEKISMGAILLSLSAFIAMNFTGASTYTSLSGVKKEMRRAVPLEILGAGAGFILWLGALVFEF
jgi:acetyl-CoA decarbonylase/synthase complex subunit gamma